jgi:hypothetical protein
MDPDPICCGVVTMLDSDGDGEATELPDDVEDAETGDDGINLCFGEELIFACPLTDPEE